MGVFIALSEIEFIGKTYKNGGSLVITIPKIWVNNSNLKENQVVQVNIQIIKQGELQI